MEKPVPIAYPSQVAVADRVTFTLRQRAYFGYVQKKGRLYAYIVCDDHNEYKVPYPLLSTIPHAPKQHVQSRAETLRLQFHVNDSVEFIVQQRTRQGTITRLNSKRAHVICENDQEFQIPYALLTRQQESGEQPDQQAQPHEERLRSIAAQAQNLLQQHGLAQWSFHFDHGRRRAGSCQYTQHVITMSYDYARHASADDIHDTLLHEIAHALVGKQHNHDAVWRAAANEIGCSGNRCHAVQFTPPRYIMKCGNGCWVATAERRRRNLVCKRCHGQITYITYTAERWQREQAAHASSECSSQ